MRPCAKDAIAAERGLPSGAESQQSEQRTSSLPGQIPKPAPWPMPPKPDLLSALIEALTLQTESINRLAASNEGLIQAMAESDGDEPEPPRRYMDGSPAR